MRLVSSSSLTNSQTPMISKSYKPPILFSYLFCQTPSAMNRLTNFLLKDQEEAVHRNHRRSNMMAAAALQIQSNKYEERQWGGSSEGRTYNARDRELMDKQLKAQYFTDPCRYEPTLSHFMHQATHIRRHLRN